MSAAALFDELAVALARRAVTTLGPLPSGTRAASVLVPFFEKDGAPHLLFVKRPEGNYRHAGQIAFPGGKRDEGDRDALAVALREAQEEVGVAPADVKLLGRLDEYDTVVSSFRVTPWVGVIPHPYPLVPDAREVERLVEAPLATLLDRGLFREEERLTPSGPRTIFYFAVGDDVIWGVTAAILVPLLDLVRELPSAPR